MTTATDYFEKTFPEIWEKVKSSIEERDGVIFLSDSLVVLYPGLSEEEVTDIGKNLKVSLPQNYREFLTHYNGCDMLNDSINIWGRKKIYVKKDYIEQQFDLVQDQKEYRENWHLSDDQIVIASDLQGVYALDVKTGKVIGTDHEESPGFHKKYKSFEEFVEKEFIEQEKGL